jgi:hypothetical protein
MLLPTKLSVRALPELWATRGQNVDNWNVLRALIVLWEDLVSKTNVWMPAAWLEFVELMPYVPY